MPRGKATLREVHDFLNGLSDSQFAVLAGGEYCEDLLGMIVGSMGRALDASPNPEASEIMREALERIERLRLSGMETEAQQIAREALSSICKGEQ
jgi:hypothetical protein